MNSAEELEQVREQIRTLRTREKQLESELISGAPDFISKLQIWADSVNKVKESWLIDKQEYPKLRKYFDGCEMQKYRTYVMDEHFEEIICLYLDDEGTDERAIEYFGELYVDAFKEAVEKNLGSFKCDW